MSKKVGGSVWESNPPLDSRRAESMALKATRITGPLSPPRAIIAGGYRFAFAPPSVFNFDFARAMT